MEEQEDYGKEILDLGKLKEVFPPEDIEWRIQSSGKKQNDEIWAKVLAYITNRAIMDRLDKVCGPENWKNSFTAAPNGGTLCGLSIKVGNEWITKWDGAENTDFEAVKGGLSGAMKRAGVQWGIGRYLYKLPTGWANITPSGRHSDKLKDGTWFKWDPPPLPKWALPSGISPEKPKKDTTQIDALKAVLSEKMGNMSDEDKKAFYGYCVGDKTVTVDLLQKIIKNYDEYKKGWDRLNDSKEA